MTADPVILWFRKDLRLTDNPALNAAYATGRPVLPLYIFDDETAGLRPPGGASQWWLHHSLSSLSQDLLKKGAQLVLRRGSAEHILKALIDETGASSVVWNRCYDRGTVDRDRRIKEDLKTRGITAESFNASLLAEPWEIKTKQGKPYRVFTPFYRTLLDMGPSREDVNTPKILNGVDTVKSDDLATWTLLPTHPNWAGGLRETWTPGEKSALQRLHDFLDGPVASYKTDRDHPGIAATSRLSPHLHFGEISPVQIWRQTASLEPSSGTETFLKELVWREFGYHLLYFNADMPTAPLQPKFERFPWRKNKKYLQAWQKGATGYPIVDAGMRELWATGTMHNRVRMVAASFLVKHLLIHWREGESWFWDTLVDADLASNTANWQWVAGCGADAAPYFRIFNPVTQGEKFDADGAYVRRWVPELAALPDKFIHHPWDAPEDMLEDAGVKLGSTYPLPIVDHAAARARALAALETIKGG